MERCPDGCDLTHEVVRRGDRAYCTDHPQCDGASPTEAPSENGHA